MTLFLERINAVPIINSDFPYEFDQWLSILVDTLNEIIRIIQDSFNFLTATNYTTLQISAMNTAGQINNGILLYDTTLNVYVGKQAGSLVKFTTAAYP